MTDDELLITCLADEAGGEPYEGKVAVAIVLLNRMRIPYESDGTAAGTVLRHFQFSGFWFSMVEGHYQQIEHDLAGAAAQAERLHQKFAGHPVWDDCQRALADARAWASGKRMSFPPGPAFAGLTPRTVLYLNLAVCRAPAWAVSEKRDAVIFHHTFYHD